MSSLPLPGLLFLACLAFVCFGSQTAGAAGNKSGALEVFPGATISIDRGMSVDRARRVSIKGTVKNLRWVRLPASGFEYAATTNAAASFERIRVRHGISNISAYARMLRSIHTREGHKKVTVRARPNQKAVEETYYKPSSQERITSKIMFPSSSDFIQGYYSEWRPSQRDTPGARAMRKVVFSLAPGRR